MRSVFARLEAEGFPADSQALWRQHWDHQLYKALEVQYKQGLEVINKNLAEVRLPCCQGMGAATSLSDGVGVRKHRCRLPTHVCGC
jgi:hypothetical protein